MNVNREKINIKVKPLTPSAKIPERTHYNDAGYDIYVDRFEDFGQYIKVYSGISVQVDIGWYLQLVARSSIYKKGLALANGIGIIDNGYRGEIIGIFYKMNNFDKIEVGERLMQLIPARYYVPDVIEVSELDISDRGDGGFGSSGKR